MLPLTTVACCCNAGSLWFKLRIPRGLIVFRTATFALGKPILSSSIRTYATACKLKNIPPFSVQLHVHCR